MKPGANRPKVKSKSLLCRFTCLVLSQISFISFSLFTEEKHNSFCRHSHKWSTRCQTWRKSCKELVAADEFNCFYRFLLSASFARCHSSRVTAPAPLCQVANLPNNLFHLPSPWLSGQRKLTQSVREVVVCRWFPQTVIVLTHFFIRGCWWNKKSLFSRNMYMTSGNLFWFCK